MVRQIYILDVNNNQDIKNLDENWLELDTLYKALALEYLAGHWDSYWFHSNNFVTYHPAEESNKYYFIDQNFDKTWGIMMDESLDPFHFPEKSYKDYVGLDWANLNSDNSRDSYTRIIVDKLIGCDSKDKDAKCTTKSNFESHLKSIVQHIFNPVALEKRIDAYKERLLPEITWDTEEVVRQHSGTKKLYDFKVDDFNHNIETGNYLGSLIFWGLKDWIKVRADSVCKEFNFSYDKVPFTPETNDINNHFNPTKKIILIIVGVVAFILISILALYFLYFRKYNKSKDDTKYATPSEAIHDISESQKSLDINNSDGNVIEILNGSQEIKNEVPSNENTTIDITNVKYTDEKTPTTINNKNKSISTSSGDISMVKNKNVPSTSDVFDIDDKNIHYSKNNISDIVNKKSEIHDVPNNIDKKESNVSVESKEVNIINDNTIDKKPSSSSTSNATNIYIPYASHTSSNVTSRDGITGRTNNTHKENDDSNIDNNNNNSNENQNSEDLPPSYNDVVNEILNQHINTHSTKPL